MNIENENTILTIEHAGNKFSAEMNWDADMDDLLDAFYGACVACTWNPKTILEGMRDYAENAIAATWPDDHTDIDED